MQVLIQLVWGMDSALLTSSQGMLMLLVLGHTLSSKALRDIDVQKRDSWGRWW